MSINFTPFYHLLCLILLVPNTVFAQTRFNIQHYTTDNGLPHNIGYNVIQDSKGYIWIGTDDGLARFDGKNFKIFRTTDGLLSNYVIDVAEDNEGTLWVGSWKGGVNCIKNDSVFTPKLSKGIFRVGHISLNKHYLATSDARYYTLLYDRRQPKKSIPSQFYQDKSRKIKYTASLPSSRKGIAMLQNVKTYLPTNASPLFFAGFGGIKAYQPNGSLQEVYPHIVKGDTIYHVSQDHTQKYWLGAKGKIISIDKKGQTQIISKGLPQRTIHDIGIASSGLIYFMTGFRNLKYRSFYCYNPATQQLVNLTNQLKSKALPAYFTIDNEDNVWLSTNGDGIYCISPSAFQNFNRNNGLSTNFITALQEDAQGNIYAGSINGLFKCQNQHFERKPLFTNNISYHIHQLTSDYQKNILINVIVEGQLDQGHYLMILNKDNVRKIRKDSIAIGQYLDKHHKLWFYDDSTFNSYPYPSKVLIQQETSYKLTKEVSINQLLENKGKLWLATNQGIFIGTAKKGKYICTDTLTTRKGLPSNQITALAKPPNGGMWIGTKQGVSLWKDGKCTNFSTKDGLIANHCTSLLVDHHGLLWIGTKQGLSCFDGKKFINYNHKTGLIASHINCLFLDSKKRLWIGTTQGISRLDIKNIPKALAPPKLYIEQVSVNGHTQAHHPHLQLPYQAQLKISFKALNYAFAQGVSYQYRLNNSTNWQTTRLNAIEYSSLPNGSHTFEVRAKKLNSDWSAPQKLVFEVVPSFWHTHWAILLYILSSALLVYGIVKWRSRRLMREKIKLEQVVIKRTYELAQQKEEMAAQAEKLKEMDQVKSQFFSNISHELRTPLTLIQAPIHKIIDTTQEDDTKKYAHLISNSTSRLLRLINQLLDLAKLEDNQLVLQPRVGKLNQFLTNNIQAFELLAQQKGITLELTLPKEEILYEFDQDKFEKIIFNLVSNALKFTPAQGQVSVVLRQTPQALLLEVSDTGQGIPPNALPFIFDRFYQVDGSQTRLHEGTGIGLALVKELVKLHEGSIAVDSQLQHGSTFTVTLPLRQILQASTSTQSRVMSAQQDGKTAYTQPPNNVHKNDQAKTVLVVEDNQALRNFIATELGANYRVIEASNGNEGIDEAKNEIPDLIITDLMMPHTDGLELLSTLRQFPPTQHIPIIILSARASIDNKIKGLQSGADDYLTKPFSPEELSLKVHNIFERVAQLKRTWQAQMDKAGIAIEPSKVTVNSMDTVFINQALQIVEDNIDNVLFDVTAFCQAIGMSRSNLHKKLKALTNLSTTEFIRTIRLKRASDLIEQNKGRIEEIALESGFNDVAYFSRCFKKQFGMTPKEYQQTHSKNA